MFAGLCRVMMLNHYCMIKHQADSVLVVASEICILVHLCRGIVLVPLYHNLPTYTTICCTVGTFFKKKTMYSN